MGVCFYNKKAAMIVQFCFKVKTQKVAGAVFVLKHEHLEVRQFTSGGTKGGGHGGHSSTPPTPNSVILGKCLIFAPSEMHFASSMPPQKKGKKNPGAASHCNLHPLVVCFKRYFDMMN